MEDTSAVNNNYQCNCVVCGQNTCNFANNSS